MLNRSTKLCSISVLAAALMTGFASDAQAALLPTPTLIGPSGTGMSTTPTFSVNPVSGANKYWLTVATTPSALPTNVNAVNCAGACVIDHVLTGVTSYTATTAPA